MRILCASERYVAHFIKIDEHSVIYFIQPLRVAKWSTLGFEDRWWVSRTKDHGLIDHLSGLLDHMHVFKDNRHSWTIKYNMTQNLIEEHQIWLPLQSEYYCQHQTVMQLVQQKLDPVQISCKQITEWFLASFGHLLKGYFQWGNYPTGPCINSEMLKTEISAPQFPIAVMSA